MQSHQKTSDILILQSLKNQTITSKVTLFKVSDVPLFRAILGNYNNSKNILSLYVPIAINSLKNTTNPEPLRILDVFPKPARTRTN